MFEDTFARIRQLMQLAIVVVQQLPRELLESSERTQELINKPGEWGPRLRKTFEVEQSGPAPKPTVPVYPAEGEAFELTLDGDAAENQPLEVVRAFGYDATNWKHNGPKVAGKQARRFKLMGLGYCRNIEEAKRKHKPHGKVPEGQWMKAFKAAYPNPDGKGPIGVADPSWARPDGGARFPFVDTDGRPYFLWADDDYDEFWRWLVEASK